MDKKLEKAIELLKMAKPFHVESTCWGSCMDGKPKQCVIVKLIKEIDKFIASVENSGRECALLSEKALGKIWNSPEEDKAWKHLKDLPNIGKKKKEKK